MFECDDENELLDKCGIKIKRNDVDSLDILRTVQENINYYKHDKNDLEYNYAHISFYKPSSNTEPYSAPMDEIETGLSLDGLVSAVTSSNLKQDSEAQKNYRTGFGTKNVNLNSKLVQFSKYLNELAFNSRKGGNELYLKNQSIVSMPDAHKNNIFNILFKKSNWVTFIDPNFGLDYFNNDKKLFIIHYSDQYSSSSKYDTITVTNKFTPYFKIIEGILNGHLKSPDFNNSDIENVIRMFNSINGEWLLNIGSNNNSEKEKLSMISAIKFVLSIFDYEDIIWIPISMGEILRVAGNLNLNEKDGLFSIKNLRKDKKGKYSDDLLLIGLNTINLDVYVYPVEVKIGKNPNIKKAKKQVAGTYMNLKEFLSKDDETLFSNKFYRNFFIQMFLSNSQKFIDNHIWDDKDIESVNDYKRELLNDDYTLSWNLESLIGIGAVIYFKEGVYKREISSEDDILLIRLPLSDGYCGVASDMGTIYDLVHDEQKTNISPEYLLCNKNIPYS